MNYRITDRYIYRNIRGEGVLVPVKEGACTLENMLLFNETSTAIWERYKDRKSISDDEVIEWITQEFEVSDGQARKDVNAFFDDLLGARCMKCV